MVADAGVAKARTAFLPVLSAGGNDMLHPRDTPFNIASGSLTLNQPLIEPSARALHAQAKHELSGQRAQSAEDRRQLAFDAAGRSTPSRYSGCRSRSAASSTTR